jgi:hypothetical protein
VRRSRSGKCEADQVEWRDGMPRTATDASKRGCKPLSLRDIASRSARPAARSPPRCRSTPRGRVPASVCTSATSRSTPRPAARDRAALHRGAGRRARDPSRVRRRPAAGRCRAGHRLGAERGVRVHAKGVLQNPGFLDYRMPVASDLPMIDTILIESAPNPRHPYGVRRAWAKCRSCRRWRPWPTPCSVPPACACARCRSRRPSCWPRSSPRAEGATSHGEGSLAAGCSTRLRQR